MAISFSGRSRAFSSNRHPPFVVLLVAAQYPLVQVGGAHDLSERYFDAASQAGRRAGLVVGHYDTILCGGEPYARWN